MNTIAKQHLNTLSKEQLWDALAFECFVELREIIQDWANEITTVHFTDDSKLIFCNDNVKTGK